MDTAPYRLESIGPGVWGAFALSMAAYANAGLVDLGDRVLLFDTGQTPAAGRFLRRAALELTGRAPDLVVNSHGHFDHVNGNTAFADTALLVSTTRARSHMVERLVPALAQAQAAPKTIRDRLAAVRGEIERTSDASKARALGERVAYLEMLLEALPELAIQLPTVTFSRRLEILGSGRRVILDARPGAHSGGDCVLAVPDAKVLMLGDLAFVPGAPLVPRTTAAHEADELREHAVQEAVVGWRGMLSAWRTSEFEVFLPGHGPALGRADLALVERAVADLGLAAGRLVT